MEPKKLRIIIVTTNTIGTYCYSCRLYSNTMSCINTYCSPHKMSPVYHVHTCTVASDDPENM